MGVAVCPGCSLSLCLLSLSFSLSLAPSEVLRARPHVRYSTFPLAIHPAILVAVALAYLV